MRARDPDVMWLQLVRTGELSVAFSSDGILAEGLAADGSNTGIRTLSWRTKKCVRLVKLTKLAILFLWCYGDCGQLYINFMIPLTVFVEGVYTLT